MHEPRLEAVSIIVLSHNRKDELVKNIPELTFAAQAHGAELVFVDNASSDGSQEVIHSALDGKANCRALMSKWNRGVAGGRNMGGKIATRSYLLFLDDDTEIDIHGIETILAFMRENTDVGAVSPRIIHALSGLPQNNHGENQTETGNYHGACHLVRREAYLEVGPIDPGCNFGGEELDASIRLRAAGYRVLYFPSVVAFHNNFPRRDAQGKWRRQRRVYNNCRLHFKYFPFHCAVLLSFRYLASQSLSAAQSHGTLFALSLPSHAAKGGCDGRRARYSIPDIVVDYYLNPLTRPDFGNVPISRKILTKLKMCGRFKRY